MNCDSIFRHQRRHTVQNKNKTNEWTLFYCFDEFIILPCRVKCFQNARYTLSDLKMIYFGTFHEMGIRRKPIIKIFSFFINLRHMFLFYRYCSILLKWQLFYLLIIFCFKKCTLYSYAYNNNSRMLFLPLLLLFCFY